MKEKYRVYPHPVLTRFSDDLVNCGFKINVGCDPEPDKYLFNCEAELTCRDLEQLIESKKASDVNHVFDKMDPEVQEAVKSLINHLMITKTKKQLKTKEGYLR